MGGDLRNQILADLDVRLAVRVDLGLGGLGLRSLVLAHGRYKPPGKYKGSGNRRAAAAARIAGPRGDAAGWRGFLSSGAYDRP
ncbi:hypothetical protein GCM10009020_02650 [Natronoarchaeum mannanilyticum]|uniref:Uncharacterized protein n=1 Tax=Natronoarchaeum mannanilyticum TaxID=926360 RepID=A0AAV3T7A3_9EURY